MENSTQNESKRHRDFWCQAGLGPPNRFPKWQKVVRQNIVIHPIILFLHVDQFFHRPIIFPSPSWFAVLCPNHVNLRFFLIWSFLRLDLQMSLHWSPWGSFLTLARVWKLFLSFFQQFAILNFPKRENCSTPLLLLGIFRRWSSFSPHVVFQVMVPWRTIASNPPPPMNQVAVWASASIGASTSTCWHGGKLGFYPWQYPKKNNWSVLALGIHSVLNQKYQKQLESNVCFLIISKDWHIISRFVKIGDSFRYLRNIKHLSNKFLVQSVQSTQTWHCAIKKPYMGDPKNNPSPEVNLKQSLSQRPYEKPFCEVIWQARHFQTKNTLRFFPSHTYI